MIEARTDVVEVCSVHLNFSRRETKLPRANDASGVQSHEDQAVDEAVALQESVGLEVVTDGEMRRLSFQSQMTEAVAGFGEYDLDAFLWGDWRGDEDAGDSSIERPNIWVLSTNSPANGTSQRKNLSTCERGRVVPRRLHYLVLVYGQTSGRQTTPRPPIPRLTVFLRMLLTSYGTRSPSWSGWVQPTFNLMPPIIPCCSIPRLEPSTRDKVGSLICGWTGVLRWITL